MSRLISIIFFIIIFGVVVVSHEFGHFLLAKAGGIHVVEFAVGMGPNLFSFQKGDTRYSLKLLPIGGACMFEGEDGLNKKEGEESPGAFPNASVWRRISTVAAGPIFNFILAGILAIILVNQVILRDPLAEKVLEDSAAMEAGLQDGDLIISLGGERIYLYEEISLFTMLNKDNAAEIVYERGGQRYTSTIRPRYDAESDRYMLGISNAKPVKLEGLDSLKYAWYRIRFNVNNTFKSLKMLVTGKVGRKDVAGPVGIANAVNDTYEQTIQYGWLDVLANMINFTLMLSVNLGILNLLPLPALDGGRLVFLFLEVLRGKPIPPEKEGMVHFVGLMFFMLLMIVVFFNDLANIFGI